ncbi:ubiquitin-conjugating enzyme E2-16 kDa-like [Drosophila obscura]|uniref:ubiquitin-conjugating enzyme E2-16 kDa-like n=1 Tax=Drosophila obscura TaxID=7282 RepID=UPI001BB23AA6|nr:ubiquitin-conjugating enzyme E2-16 kDa-like [Drosophila obscura]
MAAPATDSREVSSFSNYDDTRPDIAKYTRRIIREFIAITRNPLVGCHADIVRGDIRHWVATILGPSDTPYAGGQFHLDIRFSEEYPFLPPRVIFTTKIYHCNVDEFGTITRIEHVFVAIQLRLENQPRRKQMEKF